MLTTCRGWVIAGPLVLVVTEGCAPSLPDVADTDGTGTVDTAGTIGTETTSTEATDTDDLGVGVCGNGVVEVGEACDDEGASATCDIDCTEAGCGDRTVNTAAGEECEVTDLGGQTCMSQGFDGGTLACDGCALDTSGCRYLPSAPVLELGFSQVKQFDFHWVAIHGADYYQLLESPAPGEPFEPIAEDVDESISIAMPLHLRFEASYVLRACNEAGCAESAPVHVMTSLAEAVGYFKASNTDASDVFGQSMALSTDGNTLVVGAPYEDSNATGIDGNGADDSTSYAGAVYAFVRDPLGRWSQQAYIKASNTSTWDRFGYSVALSADGDTLAVGAIYEDSDISSSGATYVFVRDGLEQWSQRTIIKVPGAGEDWFGCSVALSGDGDTLAVGAVHEDSDSTGIGGDQANDAAPDAGAVYVFARVTMEQWSQQAYLKASNTDAGDHFGSGVVLSGDGSTLVVSAPDEDGNATGIDGNQADDSADGAGATYVFVRDGLDQWSQRAYVKASNTEWGDHFGSSIAVSTDGNALAVGAYNEGSSGAVYVFVRDGMGDWSQQTYVKASNAGSSDAFGRSVALSSDGNALAVGAPGESSNATGIGGGQEDDSAPGAGAVYVFLRDPLDQWSQQAYVKASNTGSMDFFGEVVTLSGDGNTLAVSTGFEDGNAMGIGGNQADDSAAEAGAVYLY
jgi:hypothetical protein